MKMKHYIFLILLLCANTVFAADIKVTASVSSAEVGTGEPFEVTFTISGNVERLNPPEFAGFQVISGPNQSSSFTSINGTTTSSMSVSYGLVALKPGEYTIGSAVVIAGGKQYRSNTVKIKVVKGRAVPQQNAQSGGGNQGNPAVNNAPVRKSGDISKNLFVRAVASKTNVYQGEQISVAYKLYTNVSLIDNTLDKLPEFNGFWSQEIKNNNQDVNWHTEIYKGVKYNVATLKEMILFPEHSGNLSLDPLAMTFTVRQVVPSNDIFDQFFGGGAYEDAKFKIKSPAVAIHVKPLPEHGKPASFNGAVGNFSVLALLDKTALKANEALNYSFKISGSGNLKLMNAPVLNLAPELEKYDPKLTDNITESVNGVSGSRTYNYLIIPRHEGNYTIEPMNFSYFNPATQRYVTLTASAFKVAVAKGDAVANVATYAPGSQQDIKMLNKDISYIKTGDPGLSKEEDAFYGSALFVLLLLTGPAAFVFALWYKRKMVADNKDLAKVKGRNAGKIAAKHLAAAKKTLESGAADTVFYEEIYKGLYGYLSNKFNIDASDLNQENIAEQLRLRQHNETVISRLAETLALCDMARYAPVRNISKQEVFDKAKEVISDIENFVG